MMSKKELLKKEIELWQEMIQYARKQNPNRMPLKYEMIESIGKSWQGEYSYLCNKFWRNDGCKECPIGNCNSNSLWSNVNMSQTWKEWIRNAKIFLRLIKEVYKNE